jgi:hypothetical protein
MEGWMGRRKLVGDWNESKKGGEYSCSLYLVSYEFKVVELKVKTVFEIKAVRAIGPFTKLAVASLISRVASNKNEKLYLPPQRNLCDFA